MPTLRPIAATLLVIGLSTLVSPPVTGARKVLSAIPLSAAELRHKLQTEEGARASRAMRPSPPRAPKNGIMQIPVNVRNKGALLKGNGEAPNGMARQAGPSQGVLYPPCFDPGPRGKVASLVKAFPEVTWHVCVMDVGAKGLWVGPVDIRRTPSGPWVRVLYQAGLADIFVPYHDNSGRYYDMRFSRWLDQVSAADAGPNGSLITLTHETIPTVVAEVRDRGVTWLCKQNFSIVRRGQDFVVWGVSDAGNYDNIVQMSFGDDGSMHFRLGNTGYNSPGKPSVPHMHNGLWRIDMDLNGVNNSAYWITHSEPGSLTASDSQTPFNTEGARQWNYNQFASLLIEETGTNMFEHHPGYEFTPAGTEVSRHYGPNEQWTLSDVYVTVYHPNEFGWLNTWASNNAFTWDAFSDPSTANNDCGNWAFPDYFNYAVCHWQSPDLYLLTYLSSPESVMNNDVVVWIKSAAHHDPTDEDRSSYDINPPNAASVTGVTIAHWAGFDVTPHNFFDDNPLGGPAKCGP